MKPGGGEGRPGRCVGFDEPSPLEIWFILPAYGWGMWRYLITKPFVKKSSDKSSCSLNPQGGGKGFAMIWSPLPAPPISIWTNHLKKIQIPHICAASPIEIAFDTCTKLGTHTRAESVYTMPKICGGEFENLWRISVRLFILTRNSKSLASYYDAQKVKFGPICHLVLSGRFDNDGRTFGNVSKWGNFCLSTISYMCCINLH